MPCLGQHCALGARVRRKRNPLVSERWVLDSRSLIQRRTRGECGSIDESHSQSNKVEVRMKKVLIGAALVLMFLAAGGPGFLSGLVHTALQGAKQQLEQAFQQR